MKKFGLIFSLLCCFATTMCFAQNNASQNNAPNEAYTNDMPQDGRMMDRDDGRMMGRDDGRMMNREGRMDGGGQDGSSAQPCAPGDQAMNDCYCLYCKYVPCYYNKWHCQYCPEYGCKKCCRMVDECYQKQCCRMVPQYYCQTCTRKVPQYYYEKTCCYKPKYTCEKCCKYEKKYYYKHQCEPTCNENTCTTQK